MLYLIEILHQTTTFRPTSRIFVCCILSKFYIKPQRSRVRVAAPESCILSKFYIKPQPEIVALVECLCCILSKFYIKPQPGAVVNHHKKVVSYRNSTSNHNCLLCTVPCTLLYLIEILHQTTTVDIGAPLFSGCILSKFYIKPQQAHNILICCNCCILSKFYIKPQLAGNSLVAVSGCILSKFYIKPQLFPSPPINTCVVSYRNSTSNHNYVLSLSFFRMLYLIEILHQTTTSRSGL